MWLYLTDQQWDELLQGRIPESVTEQLKASTEEAFMERLRANSERQIAPPKKRGRRRAA